MKHIVRTTCIRLGMVGIPLCLIVASCTDDNEDNDNTNTPREEHLDCPGVDGTYYYAMIPLDDCADQGVTLLDEGTPVEDQGILMPSFANCSSTVIYDGCSVESEIECPMGLSIHFSQTFTVGDPNQVTGSQEQRVDGVQDCVYEIFGATDRELVLEHAGLEDTVDVSAFSTPGTPNPDNRSAARDECSANFDAEEAVCPSGNDSTRAMDICIGDWQLHDATGCGDGWRAFINCRTEHATDMDCDTGEIPACDVYMNAYFQCNSGFTQSTGCSVAGNPETLCANGLGSYSYGCLGGEAPFADCTEVKTESAVPMFCCF